jgi:hypothetical protein
VNQAVFHYSAIFILDGRLVPCPAQSPPDRQWQQTNTTHRQPHKHSCANKKSLEFGIINGIRKLTLTFHLSPQVKSSIILHSSWISWAPILDIAVTAATLTSLLAIQLAVKNTSEEFFG